VFERQLGRSEVLSDRDCSADLLQDLGF